MRNRPTAAFTLIELLIVLAIVAILACFLFPAFASAREKGRASACLSNYHQIALAIHMYAADNDDCTPPDGGSFAGLIKDSTPYVKVDGLFACPDDYDRVKEGRAGSYRMASLYQGLRLSCGWKDPYDPTTIATPAATTLLYEAEQDYAQSPIIPTYRHNGGTQVLKFDGHTKWVKGISKDSDD